MTPDEIREHLKTSPHWFAVDSSLGELHELVSVEEILGRPRLIYGLFAARARTINLRCSLWDGRTVQNWSLIPCHEALALRMEGWTMYTAADTDPGGTPWQSLERSR